MKTMKYLRMVLILIILYGSSSVFCAEPKKIYDDYILAEERLEELRGQFLYPFSLEHYEDLSLDNPKSSKDLSFNLPFYGFMHNHTRLSLNGFLEFSDPPDILEYPLVFPNRKWPKENDPSFIGIFYSKCDIGNIVTNEVHKLKPGVYYQELSNITNKTDQETVEIRERLKLDIRDSMVGSNTFEANHVLIITWHNVTYAGSPTKEETNTFQIILATDERSTYVIYNYERIDWIKSENNIAYVGFNAGNGTNSYEYKEYSQSPKLNTITRGGMVNRFPGRYIFKIDEEIIRGNSQYNDLSNILVITPTSGNMLGGNVVHISGPVFTNMYNVKCKFDEIVVDAIALNPIRALCVQPPIMRSGYITVSVDDDESGKFKWSTQYYIDLPTDSHGVTVSENVYNFDLHGETINISWSKFDQYADICQTISLWGYRENKFMSELVPITVFATDLQNANSFQIDPDAYNKGAGIATDVYFGFISIETSFKVAWFNKVVATIWSQPIPLAWFFLQSWKNNYGKNWASHLCNEKISRDENFRNNFLMELPPCPSTSTKAQADKARFIPDPGCNLSSKIKCIHNTEATQCFTAYARSDGEQQCCYNKNGYLMLTQDTISGSFPRSKRAKGGREKNNQRIKNNIAPCLSHWYYDRSLQYLCCEWQNVDSNDCYILRNELRPTSNYTLYHSPRVASVFGDPHLITFDGLEYTFNAVGEFVLVKSHGQENELNIQARFQQMLPNKYGETKASQLTTIAVGFRHDNSTIVEVRLRPEGARWRYKLDILVNRKRIYFNQRQTQNFDHITIYTPKNIWNQSHVVIVYDAGLGVEVIENDGQMACNVYLTPLYQRRVSGLLGTYNYDLSDELTLPGGDHIHILLPTKEENRRIHDEFGTKWRIAKNSENNITSIFHYEFDRSPVTYNDETFEPQFSFLTSEIIPRNQDDIDEIHQTCLNNIQCEYDYAMTLNKDFALTSVKQQIDNKLVRHILDNTLRTCTILKTPQHGKKSTLNYTVGTTVYFECEEGYILTTNKSICYQNGIWSSHAIECVSVKSYNSSVTLHSSLFIIIFVDFLYFLFNKSINRLY